jgi:hypothetical protein
MGKVTLRWVVKGKGPWQLTFASAKGGRLVYDLK